MLKNVPHPHSLRLLDFLAPSLICRARTITSTSVSRMSSASSVQTDALQHKKIRDRIMGQSPTSHSAPDSLKINHNNYVVDLRRATAKQDLRKALSIWGRMKKEREDITGYDRVYKAPEHAERQIALMFASHCSEILGNTSDDMKEIALDFAVSAAARDITEALHTVMLDYINRNEPQAAIDLYAEYRKLVDKPAEEEEELSVFSATGLLITGEPDADQSFNPGRVSLLLAVTTAYAMKDSFSGALSSYLSANIRPPTFRTLTLLKSLEHTPELKAKVERYLHRLSIASLVARPTSLSKHIMNISTTRTTRLLEQLYKDVIDGITGEDPYLAVGASTLSSTRLVCMTEAGWTAFQTGFLKSERPDLASNVWKDIADCGFVPGVSMWTALIDTHASLRDSQQAMLTWNLMLQSGVKPDALSYRAIIIALFDDNNAEAALSKFKEFHQSPHGKSEISIVVFNTVLKGLLRAARIKDANALMDIMLKKGPTPDIISYNTLLAYYSRKRDFKGLSQVVQQMSEAEIVGDVVTFSTILTALLNAGRKDADLTILNLMRKQGIKPNVATYSAIIDHQMRQETEQSLTAALNILEKMEQDDNAKPNEVTYTSILSGIYRNQCISRERAEEIKTDIVRRMRRDRITFKLPTYHILIRAALNSPSPDGYLDAISLLDDMERQGLPRTNTVWYILFAGLMGRQQWDVAKVMVERMEHSGHQPTPRVQRLVNDIKQK